MTFLTVSCYVPMLKVLSCIVHIVDVLFKNIFLEVFYVCHNYVIKCF